MKAPSWNLMFPTLPISTIPLYEVCVYNTINKLSWRKFQSVQLNRLCLPISILLLVYVEPKMLSWKLSNEAKMTIILHQFRPLRPGLLQLSWGSTKYSEGMPGFYWELLLTCQLPRSSLPISWKTRKKSWILLNQRMVASSTTLSRPGVQWLWTSGVLRSKPSKLSSARRPRHRLPLAPNKSVFFPRFSNSQIELPWCSRDRDSWVKLDSSRLLVCDVWSLLFLWRTSLLVILTCDCGRSILSRTSSLHDFF